MEPDGPVDGRIPGRRAPSSGFQWVSSSPTQAEVSVLEARFPEVIQVPVADLEAVVPEWSKRAVLVRTLLRWVPAEAFLREFRRAGLAGEIAPLSLSFRCHIFKFADEGTRDAMLQRPWVINGQPVAAEAWRPDFIPAADEVTSALLWIRLPNLPLEFWSEEILRAVVAPAGQFVSVDAATMGKTRGGFARVCVRVQLCSPLRPGTRVRGLNGPFWQSYVYEQVDGICHRCASLHFSGSCDAEGTAEAEEGPDGLRFGSWMSAIRQRRGVKGAPAERFSKKQADDVPASSASRAPAPVPAEKVEGWVVPSKSARRRRLRGAQVGQLSTEGQAAPPGHKLGLKSSGNPLNECVPGAEERAGLLNVGNEGLSGVSDIQISATDFPLQLISKNPFASLSMDLGGISPMGIRDATSGPLKRARPADHQAPRILSKMDKKKGKGLVSTLKAKQIKTNTLDDLNDVNGFSPLSQSKDLLREKGLTLTATASPDVLLNADSMDQVAGTGSDALFSQSTAVRTLISSSSKLLEEGTVASGCCSDRSMDALPGEGGC